MRAGSCPDDGSFDRFLPEPLKLVSPEYWTPLAVAQQAAKWADDSGFRTVVDIGSGAGKFCVAAALFGKCRFIGLEQYSSLVTSARALVDLFDQTTASASLPARWEACPLRSVMRTIFSTRSVSIGSGQTVPRRRAPSSPTVGTETMSLRRRICFGACLQERVS